MKSDSEILKIQADLKAKGVKYCVGAYVDIHGVPKGKFAPIDHFLHFAHGEGVALAAEAELAVVRVAFFLKGGHGRLRG